MKKTMYSLMLAEEVVQKIDRLACEQGTNRSNFINQILAEYVSLTTPEKHVSNIFDRIETLIGKADGFLFYSQPNDMTMSIKSSLQYHYRPTIRYEVEMYRMPENTIGQLKIIFRTQSPELLVGLTRFFKLWMRLEDIYIKHFFPENAIRYGIENGKFLRTFAIPDDAEYSEEQIAQAIGNYIAAFDEMLKNFLGGKYENTEALEQHYLAYLNGGALLI